MDDSSVSGRNEADEPRPTWPELKTDNILVALTAQLRFAIVSSWLPPEPAA